MKQPKVAYFCMEFGLENQFKTYSGGLGILAGDILKAAKELDYPMVGVGMLWRQGYNRQSLDENGMPVDCFHEYRYDFLKDTGVEVSVEIRKRTVKAKVWLCDCFENAPLYLLDTFIEGNNDNLISGQLYGWFEEERIAQEMILGICGVKALRKLGFKPDIYHFNDSHPVFAGLELIKREMKTKDISFEKALKSVRKKIVFTTHTPVDAGNEKHDFSVLRYMRATSGFSAEQMKLIGDSPFNMTVAGLRLANVANGVSKLHAKTAKKMWSKVKSAAPIVAVTNGVHNKTWQIDGISELCGEDDGEKLLALHQEQKSVMLSEIEKRCGVKLSKDALTIGFARRAASYKRGDMIFSDMSKLDKLLKENKLNLVFSGKAHPNDLEGKKIISNLYSISKEYDNIVFLENYDMEIGKLMTRGCDVWLNTPRRPQEACGTSGMKAAMNGVLNFSVLDGWWDEYCEHGINGWKIGSREESEDRDKRDAKSLYKVLLEEIVPTYYDQKDKWLQMMRRSISTTTYKFSAERMLKDYIKKVYLFSK